MRPNGAVLSCRAIVTWSWGSTGLQCPVSRMPCKFILGLRKFVSIWRSSSMEQTSRTHSTSGNYLVYPVSLGHVPLQKLTVHRLKQATILMFVWVHAILMNSAAVLVQELGLGWDLSLLFCTSVLIQAFSLERAVRCIETTRHNMHAERQWNNGTFKTVK